MLHKFETIRFVSIIAATNFGPLLIPCEILCPNFKVKFTLSKEFWSSTSITV